MHLLRDRDVACAIAFWAMVSLNTNGTLGSPGQGRMLLLLSTVAWLCRRIFAGGLERERLPSTVFLMVHGPTRQTPWLMTQALHTSNVGLASDFWNFGARSEQGNAQQADKRHSPSPRAQVPPRTTVLIGHETTVGFGQTRQVVLAVRASSTRDVKATRNDSLVR